LFFRKKKKKKNLPTQELWKKSITGQH
jgi:hypothetical protein